MMPNAIDNTTLDTLLKRLVAGQVSSAQNNLPKVAVNIPLANNDATTHEWDFEINGVSLLNVKATGDGVGGIKQKTITVDGDFTATSYNIAAATWTRYVDSVGGLNTNDGLTNGTAWQTLPYAYSQIPVMASGVVRINVLDGTNDVGTFLQTPDFKAKVGDSSGSVVLQLIGNAANPGNCIIKGTQAAPNIGIIHHVNTNVTLFLNGFNIQHSTGSSSSCGLYFENAKCNWQNITQDNIGFGQNCQGFARVTGLPKVGGDTWNVKNDGLIVNNGAFFQLFRPLTCNGVTNFGVLVGDNSKFIHNQSLTIVGNGVNMNNGVFVGSTGAMYSVGDIIIRNAQFGGDAAGILIQGNGFYSLSGSATFDNCALPLKMYQKGIFVDALASTYTYLNGTPTTVIISQGVVFESHTTLGATVTITDVSGFKYGFDARYTETKQGDHTGAVPAGVKYLAHGNVQNIPKQLYTAKRPCKIGAMTVNTLSINGPVDDVYTLVLGQANGTFADTAAAITLNNATSGSATFNPINIVAGQWIAIKGNWDPASTADSPCCQFEIEQN